MDHCYWLLWTTIALLTTTIALLTMMEPFGQSVLIFSFGWLLLAFVLQPGSLTALWVRLVAAALLEEEVALQRLGLSRVATAAAADSFPTRVAALMEEWRAVLAVPEQSLEEEEEEEEAFSAAAAQRRRLRRGEEKAVTFAAQRLARQLEGTLWGQVVEQTKRLEATLWALVVAE